MNRREHTTTPNVGATSRSRIKRASTLPDYHSSRLRAGRHSEVGLVYAITKCCAGRSQFLASGPTGAQSAQVIASTIENMDARGIWQPYGLVVMPDHVHMVVKLGKGTLSDAVKAFSTFTSGRINRLLNRRGPLWQAGFYDQALRGEKTLGAYLEYMLMNPVRAGLVESPQDWPYSVFDVRPRPLSTVTFEALRRQEAAPTTNEGAQA